MINKKFNDWTVISLGEPDKRNRKRYLCKCKCGTQKLFFPWHLLNRPTKHCWACRRKKMPIGSQYGSWTVVENIYSSEKKKMLVRARCSCGEYKKIAINDLKRGKTTQCASCYKEYINKDKITHGMSKSRIYYVWSSLKDRCLRESCSDYRYYGGRGIGLNSRWLTFANFYEDMGDPPRGYQIDRIDNDGNYGPDNCRWVSPKDNSNNRRPRGKSVKKRDTTQ